MFGRKKKKRGELNDIDRASEELLQSINDLEDIINRRSGRTMQPSRNTLPPPDRVRESHQHKILTKAVSRGNVRNVRREIVENTLLLILLIGAILASSYWVLNLLKSA